MPVIFLTSGTTWTVPSDWNNAANTIECIGGGGGGYSGNVSHVGSGGEGGHYAKSANVTLTPSSTINIAIGAGGTGGAPATAGGSTWLGGTSLATSFCGAVGGAAATNTSSDATTATTNDVGNVVVRQGGLGRSIGGDHQAGSGGGGAAGPGGVGGGGNDTGAFSNAGGAGGGAGNTGGAGGTGGAVASNVVGGVGGTAGDGTAGGAGTGAAGSHGSGGGGGTGGTVPPATAGGAGGAGVDSAWDATHGPGGGGGGGGTDVSVNRYAGGAGGLYGGGGGGGAYPTGAGGNGANGIIVITYTPAVTYTTWNPGDRNSQVTLSGGNLVATCATFTVVGVRAIDAQFSGKFYWECTQTSAANIASGVGFLSPDYNLMTTFINGTVGSCGIHRSGQIYNDGAFAGVTFGTITNGTVICLAIDCTARLVWFRLGAAGNWNNSATANPATGVGGITTSLGIGIPVYPAVSLANTPDQYTANFGASAFTGTVPSGFTSGWPAGHAAPMRATLLVHADGANGSTTFTDEAGNLPLTTSGAVVTTTSPKFGTGSASFPTSAAWIGQASGSTTNWNFGGGPFTVEAWMRFTSTPISNQGVVTQFGGAGNFGWFLGLVSGSFNFYYSTTGGDNPFVGAAFSPTLNQWYHAAADRDASNVLRVYIDGVVIASATVSATFFDSTRNLVIGNDQNTTRGFPGQLDEIRVTKGFARYGGAFTPPTAAFSLDPNTFTNVLATQVVVEHWYVTNPDAQVTQVAVEHWTSVQVAYPAVTNPSLVLSGSRAGIGSVVVSR